MIAPLLPLGYASDGQALDLYGHYDDTEPVSCQIPGSPTRQTVTLLRAWAAVSGALDRDNRDLSSIPPDDSILGIGRESPYGLHRLNAAHNRYVLSIINPLFSPGAVA